MKKISSLDTHYLVKELRSLEGSRIDKIFSLGKEEVYLQLYQANEGKRLLRVILGSGIFIAKKKIVDETPSHFCMVLRKHLDGKRLIRVEQVQPERIIKFLFQSKETEFVLYIELFGKGNVILCQGDTIIDSLLRQRFKDRSILPKKNYSYPNMPYNLFEISKAKLSELLKNSKRDTLIISLATELGLGGVYAEEVCLMSKIDKNTNPTSLKGKEIDVIIDSLQKVQNKKLNPSVIFEDKKAIDITPFSFLFYSGNEKKEFASFMDGLQHYFTKELVLVQEKKSPYEKQIQQLQRIISEQEETINQLEKKEQENKRKGEILYEQYALVKEILDEIGKASQSHSWKEIKDKLKGHSIIKDVDVKNKKVTVEF